MEKICAGRKQQTISKKSKNAGGPVIETESGAVRGFLVPIENGRLVSAFLGIPYAEAPVGERRFQDIISSIRKDTALQKPQKRTAWVGVRNCLHHGPCAPQKFTLLEKLYLHSVPKPSEDCLYLNVFAPAWKPDESQPNGFAVLIYIHGGAFGLHSSAYYGDISICRHLCSKDVIVVTIQYRLGILGFGTTGEPDCPPNLGLWDQARALDWVRTNIASFGGNPKNITLCGQSAGAASADLLSLSPYTRDKFEKVVALSGSANCFWVLNCADDVRHALIHTACKLGWKAPKTCNFSDSSTNSSLLKFLKMQSADRLALGMKIFLRKRDITRTTEKLKFTPVIDGDFLPEPISELRKKSPQKMCMIGTTECEAVMLGVLGRVQDDRRAFLRLIEALLPNADPEILSRAKSLYIENGTRPKIHYSRAFMKLYGDILIINGVHSYAQEMNNAGHCVYLYNFDYHPRSFGAIDMFIPFLTATHGTELPYLFGKTIIQKYKFLTSDYCVLNNFTTLITNFAKYGTPNLKNLPIWEPLSIEDPWRYLNINETCAMRKNHQDCRPAFWSKLDERMVSNIAVPMALV